MRTLILSTTALLLASPTLAQQPHYLVSAPTRQTDSLPSNSEVWLSLNDSLTSQRMTVGSLFDLSVSRDVMLGDAIVIPRGTPAHGRVSYRTGKGAFGKSAKMEFDLVDVRIGERWLPLAGHYRLEGEGNTGATIGAIVAAGVVAGAFVTGHSATAEVGSEWRAFTTAPILAAAAPAPVAPRIARVAAVDAEMEIVSPLPVPGRARRLPKEDVIEVVM